MDYDRAIEYRLVSYNQGWSFTPIWKNGTKTIFETFSKGFENIYRDKNTKHQIHAFIDHPPESDDLKMLHKDSSQYLDFVENSFNFVCLRDPYLRFISNFYDKVIINPNGKESAFFLSKYGAYEFDAIKKLKLFLLYLENGENIDPHFYTQSKIADVNKINYHYFIDIKTIEKDWNILSNRFSNIPKLFNKNTFSSNSLVLANIISNDKNFKSIYKKINMIYLDDYKLLESLSK